MLKNKKIGIGLTGSFLFATKDAGCNKRISSFRMWIYIYLQVKKILNCNTRFNKADELIDELEKLSKRKVITNVVDSENIWTQKFLWI